MDDGGEEVGEGTHVIGPGLDLLVQLVLVLVPEGGVAHQQDVEDHTCHAHQKHTQQCSGTAGDLLEGTVSSFSNRETGFLFSLTLLF